MPSLASNLRKQLENVCIQARDKAEEAARSALQKRAVHEARPFAHFDDEEKRLRRWLRARGKQAGDVEDAEKKQSIEHLTQELAYEYWHRMLFARFLAENHLLMHPHGVAVSLEECEELAASERAPNGYVLAARYASRMLPQIFRIDDVLLEIEFAPEHRLALERLLASVPRETFQADDSLGWVYQFWQTKKKEEVNRSGAKIDGRTLPAVTQLFTEDYMVQFLLHNTIGAWWCARNGIDGPAGGAGVPPGKSPVSFDYLRWAPAPVDQPLPAGTTQQNAQPGAAVPQGKELKQSRNVDQPLPAGTTQQNAQPGAAVPQGKELKQSRNVDQPLPAGTTQQNAQPGAAVPQGKELKQSRNVDQPLPAGTTQQNAQPGAAVPQGKELKQSRNVDQPPPAGSTLAKPVRAEYRRNLPHLQADGKTYYVTFCTHQRWTLPREVRPLVVKHCLHDQGEKLQMHALVVMPDHVHLIFTPLTDVLGNTYGLSEILAGIKGASAHTINKYLTRRGNVWQDESFDHILRHEEKLEEKIEYVRQNPVRKGIVSKPEEYPYTWVEGHVAQPPPAVRQNPVRKGIVSKPEEYPYTWVEGHVAQPPPAVPEYAAEAEHGHGSEDTPAQPRAAVPHSPLSLPAAGTFDGWPTSLKEFTMLDPCCGSGHFLVAAFRLLVPLRMHDEGLSTEEACDAVLRGNLFGLELDPRCTQIAAFALAMAAWTYPGPDGQPLGYRPLPALNIACSGQGVVGSKEDWAKFAGSDGRFREGMERLYDLFQRAPDLGSLLDPRTVTEDLFALGFDTLKGTVERALKKIEARDDPDRVALGVAAQGIALAASLMSREFTLVATNVPYLARGKQAEVLRRYIEDVHSAAKADLATAFVERCLDYCRFGGTTALVTPQNWLFLGSYRTLREWLLRKATWNLVAKLGPAAFDDMNWWAANTMLSIHTASQPVDCHELAGVDASSEKGAANKGKLLLGGSIAIAAQSEQLLNPDARISLDSQGAFNLLSKYANSYTGVWSGDSPRFRAYFWEIAFFGNAWEYFQSTVEQSQPHGGRESVILFEQGVGALRNNSASQERDRRRDRQGINAWEKVGVAVSCMRVIPVTLYEGTKFDTNVATIIPHDPSHLPAIWCFCKSPEFYTAVRRIDQKVNVTNATLVKVPFDLERWQQIAAEEYPNGLPEPHSDDPTQWLFKGHPKDSTDPLQVAVARFLGYCWPDQEPDSLDSGACGTAAPGCPDPAGGGWATSMLIDADGIVPIPSVWGEPPAAERLREILKTAFGSEWSASLEHNLLTGTGANSGTGLDDWLRNSFFEQHCKRFHHRPFVWHIWDGRKDGFSCLVNYHKLNRVRLESLTYSYLQDWINLQAADARGSKLGADLRLAAAQALQEKLKLILAGEPPYDIFVRWKPLSEQPIGWNPDLNDGVRMNIRPFVQAGILRKNPNIKWTKDRGNEPQRPKEEYPWFWAGGTFKGDRVNDVHLTIQQKVNARKGRS